MWLCGVGRSATRSSSSSSSATFEVRFNRSSVAHRFHVAARSFPCSAFCDLSTRSLSFVAVASTSPHTYAFHCAEKVIENIGVYEVYVP